MSVLRRGDMFGNGVLGIGWLGTTSMFGLLVCTVLRTGKTSQTEEFMLAGKRQSKIDHLTRHSKI
jgi:hypothetical protein